LMNNENSRCISKKQPPQFSFVPNKIECEVGLSVYLSVGVSIIRRRGLECSGICNWNTDILVALRYYCHDNDIRLIEQDPTRGVLPYKEDYKRITGLLD